MTEVGEFEFMVQDEWGQGIPLTDSVQGIMNAGVTVMAVMAILREALEGVIE